MPESIINWLTDHGIRIAIIILLGLLLDKTVDRFADRTIKKFVVKKQQHRDMEEIEQRAETLTDVFNTTTSVVVTSVVIMMVLPELGMAIGPLLAGAGVVGLAVGFGAQNLVRDFFAGLFILIEDQYSIGDVIRVGDVAGSVEIINLRRTVLRDLDGVQHHIPNGEIKLASNLTKDWSKINIQVPVSYDTNIDMVTALLNKIGKDLAESEEYKESFIDAPNVLGLDKFGPSELLLKVVAKTRPGKQWEMARELRKRIKTTFDEEGIEIPFPQRVVHQINK
ncbi:mechanosensitive ion channel family protein [Patescibacteria group bacterium]|nr:mechanosensitive ion channel family protein [Patescibacteria group bacterium]MBU1074856.1 mechanosensitive ion channel family protein [Patescibacteria group bacterium]MBU1951387.1 mechanosensitive ion channel family protein [Patescibacteria group bacterium]